MKYVRGIWIWAATFFELVRGIWSGPHWYLVPLIFVLLPAAILFIVLQTVPIVAPFVYTLF